MSSLNFIDFTIAGAYMGAIKAADKYNWRGAIHHADADEPPARLGYLPHLIRRIIVALVDRRLATLRPTSRQV